MPEDNTTMVYARLGVAGVKRLKILAIQRGIKIQEIFQQALQDWWKKQKDTKEIGPLFEEKE